MDIQRRSYPIMRGGRRRNSVVRYGSAILLLLCVTPCTVWAQTGLTFGDSFAVGTAPAKGDAVGVLADTLNPRQSQESMLLMRDDVQHELNLNPRQQEQIATLSEKTKKSLLALSSKRIALLREGTAGKDSQPSDHTFSIGPDGEITGKGADAQIAREVSVKMQDAQAQALQDAQKERDAILTPTQRRRLKELDMQWRGPLLLLSTIGIEEMKLSDEQWTKFQAVWANLQTQVAQNEKAVLPKAGAIRREYGEDAEKQEGLHVLFRQLWRDDRKARVQAEKQALAVLTSEQKRQWATWTGKPFNFRDYGNSDSLDRPSLPR